MAVDFYIKQDDRLPEISSILKDAEDAIINLSGASVKFIMTNKLTGEKKIDADAEVVSAVAGSVKYAWIEGDTDESGAYRAEWEIEFADGRLMTVPNRTYLNVKVVADLGGVDGTPA